MEWERVSQYAIRTSDGTYSVAKFHTPGGPRYEAWRTRAHKRGAGLISIGVRSADEAKEIAERDSLLSNDDE